MHCIVKCVEGRNLYWVPFYFISILKQLKERNASESNETHVWSQCMYGGVGFRFASVLYVWKNYKILFIFDLDTLILLSRTYDTNVHTSTMLLNENALLPFIHFNSTFLIASGATLLSWVCIMAATLVVSLALSEKLYNVLCLERELHSIPLYVYVRCLKSLWTLKKNIIFLGCRYIVL